MSHVFISDIHVTDIDDNHYHTLISFLKSSQVKESSSIYFLGDVFDFLVGEKKGYLKKYPQFFQLVVQYLNEGKRIVFLEGNHDFHFEKTFVNYVFKNSKHFENFTYLKDGFIADLDGEKVYLCHGDEVDYKNESFKKWKRIYRSSGFQILVNFLLPYYLILKLGDWASKDSKKRGIKEFQYDRSQKKYRSGADYLLDLKNVNTVICGHTHIIENHVLPNGKTYLNIGFPPVDKKFLLYKNNKFEHIDLKL